MDRCATEDRSEERHDNRFTPLAASLQDHRHRRVWRPTQQSLRVFNLHTNASQYQAETRGFGACQIKGDLCEGVGSV